MAFIIFKVHELTFIHSVIMFPFSELQVMANCKRYGDQSTFEADCDQVCSVQ